MWTIFANNISVVGKCPEVWTLFANSLNHQCCSKSVGSEFWACLKGSVLIAKRWRCVIRFHYIRPYEAIHDTQKRITKVSWWTENSLLGPEIKLFFVQKFDNLTTSIFHHLHLFATICYQFCPCKKGKHIISSKGQ